jgi:cellulose synthase/poly-beta-1,6-N-acetylglucosamine synthase-like glycosyltransferase
MYVPIGANMFIRKALLKELGGFSTQLGYLSKEELICGEDSEIMFRFKYAGERILYYPNALISHPVPVDRLQKSYFKKWCWGVGRGRARWLSVPPKAIRYGNIPRYLIKELVKDLIQWVIVIPSPKKYKRFYYEMQILFKLGMFFEFYITGD